MSSLEKGMEYYSEKPEHNGRDLAIPRGPDDEQAWQAIQDYIRVLALTLTKQADAAEEVTADVMLILVKKLEQFEKKSSFKTWLYKIVTNQINTTRRQAIATRRDARQTLSLEDLPARLEPRANHGPGHEEMLEMRNLLENLERKLGKNKITQENLQLLRLKEQEGYSVEELAKMFGINEQTIKTKLARTRQALLSANEELKKRAMGNRKTNGDRIE